MCNFMRYEGMGEKSDLYMEMEIYQSSGISWIIAQPYMSWEYFIAIVSHKNADRNLVRKKGL